MYSELRYICGQIVNVDYDKSLSMICIDAQFNTTSTKANEGGWLGEESERWRHFFLEGD